MDLLRTILVYLTMIFISSVQSAPDPSEMPELLRATETPVVEVVSTSTPEPTPSPTPVPTIDITPNPEYSNIRVGDNGEEVLQLQTRLAEYGYYTGEIDGRFGNQTRRAVELFQYNHGLTVDGVAGRGTLTVLYESEEVRPIATQTPEPTVSTDNLSAALSLTETTPAPTFIPTPTPEVSDEPSDAPTEAPATTEPAIETLEAASAEPSTEPSTEPSAEPEPTTEVELSFVPVEDCTLVLMTNANGEADGETILTSATSEEPLSAYALGETVYVPFLRLMEQAGSVIVPSTGIELDEYAFVIGDDLYRVSHTEDQAGQPQDLNVYKNGEPQIVPVRDIRLVDDVLYMPAESFASLTGVQFHFNEDTRQIEITFAMEE